jgi:hypothetical protein
MNAILTLLYIVLCISIVVVVPTLVATYAGDYGVVSTTDTAKAVLLSVSFAFMAGLFIYIRGAYATFLIRLFMVALMLRMVLGTAIFVFHGQEFFGGDALTYDFFGSAQLQAWQGDKYMHSVANLFTQSGEGSGWGMVYMVAAIYGLIGRNMLAIQLVNSVFGAATAVVIFLCAHRVFSNLRVARFASIAVAFYPSLVLWSSQGLKDGPIVFFLALSILATLRLGEELSAKYITALIVSLIALLSLRFYVFYMICIAVVGAFVIGMQSVTAKSFARQFVAMLLLGLALTYFGVTRSANVQFERYGSLQRVQRTRLDAATSAESGFGQDVDVSTSAGALSTIPMGLIYLLFAPFPWQMASLRQSITLPEMIVWWASVPLLVVGLWFSMRYRLRMISPMLIFTAMLSLAYSVFQGNVGTAYRQRAQLLVFYFIFAAVGLVLVLEKREEKKRRDLEQRRTVAAHQAAALEVRAGMLSKSTDPSM